jgi:hypothetical protein
MSAEFNLIEELQKEPDTSRPFKPTSNNSATPRVYVEEEKTAFEMRSPTLIKLQIPNMPRIGIDFIQPGGRRSTRQNGTIESNEGSSRAVPARRLQDDSEPLLSKTTRSGRQLKVKRKNLKEDSQDESDFSVGDEEAPPTGSKKRLRRL